MSSVLSAMLPDQHDHVVPMDWETTPHDHPSLSPFVSSPAGPPSPAASARYPVGWDLEDPMDWEPSPAESPILQSSSSPCAGPSQPAPPPALLPPTEALVGSMDWEPMHAPPAERSQRRPRQDARPSGSSARSAGQNAATTRQQARPQGSSALPGRHLAQQASRRRQEQQQQQQQQQQQPTRLPGATRSRNDRVRLDKASATQARGRECLVCLEGFGPNGSEHEAVRVRGCGHIFGRRCVDGDADGRRGRGGCPHCRQTEAEADRGKRRAAGRRAQVEEAADEEEPRRRRGRGRGGRGRSER